MSKLISILLIISTQLCFGQKAVHLKINHLLGSNNFALNQTATNNLGNSFEVTRLQYYISNITLYHDGTQTSLPNTYILVDASRNTNELLGNFNISMLDSISFGVGVDTASNHDDPSLFPNTHALAPKAPSMHWGWTAGYRFVAFEGTTGTASDVFQMHGLNDANFFTQTLVTNGMSTASEIDIILGADYTEALRDININGGVVSHGGSGAAQQTLQNFYEYVFSDASSVSITTLPTLQIALYPNPVQLGELMKLEVEESASLDIQVYDLTGKLVPEVLYNTSTGTLQFSQAGWYIVQVLKDKQTIATRRVQVQE